jgi:diguanylate cyclase (GGDEF)-like protein
VSVEQILVLLVFALVANIVVMAIVLWPVAIGRGKPSLQRVDEVDRHAAEVAATVGGPVGGPLDPLTVPTRAYDRVVRIVSWTFILATGTIVAVTGLWPNTQVAIFVLLALAGAFVLVVHDLLPPDALGPAKFIIEGSVAITFATILVALTGGAASPFFFTFFLIVGGAALVVSPRVTLALVGIACVGYTLAVLTTPANAPPSGQSEALVSVAKLGIDLTALIMLAYVAMVIAREQRRSRDAAIRLSTVDPLTGLFNRTYFFAAVDREIARSARSGRGFCLLMMDLDGLKSINDKFGHFHGDRVLRQVGEVIESGVRRIDTAARYGGDEFVVLLPETDPSGAYVLAEKVRLGVADLSVDVNGMPIRPSMSVGVVAYPDDGRTSDELTISADQAMYASKRGGKNRVMGLAVVGERADDSV